MIEWLAWMALWSPFMVSFLMTSMFFVAGLGIEWLTRPTPSAAVLTAPVRARHDIVTHWVVHAEMLADLGKRRGKLLVCDCEGCEQARVKFGLVPVSKWHTKPVEPRR